MKFACVKRRTNGRTDEQGKHELMNGQTSGQTSEQVSGFMNKRTDEWTNGEVKFSDFDSSTGTSKHEHAAVEFYTILFILQAW